MHTLNQMDPRLAAEARRIQAELWESVFLALDLALERLFRGRWTVEPGVSVEEIFSDLAYGRD